MPWLPRLPDRPAAPSIARTPKHRTWPGRGPCHRHWCSHPRPQKCCRPPGCCLLRPRAPPARSHLPRCPAAPRRAAPRQAGTWRGRHRRRRNGRRPWRPPCTRPPEHHRGPRPEPGRSPRSWCPTAESTTSHPLNLAWRGRGRHCHGLGPWHQKCTQPPGDFQSHLHTWPARGPMRWCPVGWSTAKHLHGRTSSERRLWIQRSGCHPAARPRPRPEKCPGSPHAAPQRSPKAPCPSD
mmetsp:Transcript_104444/g.248481  ORF Transcript_104444/g.248481 Transcript_104444/m.248481 type:complete len:237 (+) Transcript_104444:768-1478(+)